MDVGLQRLLLLRSSTIAVAFPPSVSVALAGHLQRSGGAVDSPACTSAESRPYGDRGHIDEPRHRATRPA
jgi:hypothetical protein